MKSLLLFKHGQKHACSSRGTDGTGKASAHGVHQEIILRVILLSPYLGHTRRHGNGGNPRDADDGVDLVFDKQVHDFHGQDAAGSTDHEIEEPEAEDHEGFIAEKDFCLHGSAHANAEKDGYNVHHRAACRPGQTFYHAAFLHEVAEHEHTHQGHDCRDQEGNNPAADKRVEYLFLLGDGPHHAHLDKTFFIVCHEPHNGWLDQGHHGHIGVCRQGIGAQEMRGKPGCEIDRGRAVGAADDTQPMLLP